MYLRLIHRVLQRELAQCRKAVILQLKKKRTEKQKQGRQRARGLILKPSTKRTPFLLPSQLPPTWASQLPSTPAPVALDMLICPSAYFVMKLARGSPSCSLVSETWAETVLCSCSVLCGWQVSRHEGIKSLEPSRAGEQKL